MVKEKMINRAKKILIITQIKSSFDQVFIVNHLFNENQFSTFEL